MPDAYHILIPPEAAGDLVEICSYIERQSPQNAASVAQELSHKNYWMQSILSRSSPAATKCMSIAAILP